MLSDVKYPLSKNLYFYKKTIRNKDFFNIREFNVLRGPIGLAIKKPSRNGVVLNNSQMKKLCRLVKDLYPQTNEREKSISSCPYNLRLVTTNH